ncbi:hypothetical protein D7294_01875 [Streptomyces hoynatensis]|uniref:Uncharacterized protein n=2 Tax=Streptomyces hoynatensis TaxID=1141874 RepID=A0A3A9ZF37_9ACTN|nr:hypothetical protein D7294_01875 [Streptomyces hoynatensis]
MSEWLPQAASDLNEYTVTPGVLGFIVFAVLGVGVWILLKSMSKHLGRISLPDEAGAGPRQAEGSPAPGGATAPRQGRGSSEDRAPSRS